MKLLLAFIILSFIGFNCGPGGAGLFMVKMRHYAGGAGLTVYYSVNNYRVEVRTNCDLTNCSEKIVYKRALSREELDMFRQRCRGLNIYGLKEFYEDSNVMDGLNSVISIYDSNVGSKTIRINNYEVPLADSLYKYVDDLIWEKKYKFFHFGEE
ncbi:MAG: hypothetical protein WCF67_13365 [Chitinophagaceae bacterium]